MDTQSIELLLEKSKHLKVLYVEDDDASRDSTLQSLNIFFEDITLADNGEEGYEAFVDSKFDLIITDLRMPVLSGEEMIEKIRQIDSEIIILILSADVSAKSFTKTIRAGIEGYLLKPIDIEQFVALIKKSVDNIINKKEMKNYKENLEKKVQEQTLKIRESISMNPSLIKIDAQLIAKMIENEKAMLMLKHISSLAKMLEIKVVAENIESKEMLDIVKEMGIDYVQSTLVGQLVSE